MNEPSPKGVNLRPHPLAEALAERLSPEARILEIAPGSGRNTRYLQSQGFSITAVADHDEQQFRDGTDRYDAVLTTHGFLHGTRASITPLLREVASSLKPHAPLYCTFASKRDVRYGVGERIAEDAFAATDGDEAGVAHVFFDENGLRELLSHNFVIEALDERAVDEIVGRWAHSERPAGSVHWFARAARR